MSPTRPSPKPRPQEGWTGHDRNLWNMLIASGMSSESADSFVQSVAGQYIAQGFEAKRQVVHTFAHQLTGIPMCQPQGTCSLRDRIDTMLREPETVETTLYTRVRDRDGKVLAVVNTKYAEMVVPRLRVEYRGQGELQVDQIPEDQLPK